MDFEKSHEKSDFLKIFFQKSKFQFWKNLKIDENKCALMFQWVGNDHISFQKKMAQWNYEFMTTHKKFQKSPKIQFFKWQLFRLKVLRDEFLSSEKFFHSKVWVLENIFHIYHVVISSIDQKIFNFLWKKLPQ